MLPMAVIWVIFSSALVVHVFGRLTLEEEDLAQSCNVQSAPLHVSEFQPDSIAFMQLKLQVQKGEAIGGFEQLAVPMGETFLSTEPSVSANWWVKYFNATAVPLADCDGVERAAVRLPPELSFSPDTLPLLVFIKDESLPTCGLDVALEMNYIEASLALSASGEFAYNFRVDSHMGFADKGFALACAALQVDDGLVVAGFGHDPDLQRISSGNAVMQIPHTSQVVQVSGASKEEQGITFLVQNDCRHEVVGLGRFGSWWKSTFVAARPEVAADFAINVLGASQIESTYDVDAPFGCTSAAWVQLPSGFQLHFVHSSGYQTYPSELQDFTDRVRSVRNLTAGVFDRFMYNSLLLRVPSLDPYIRRLQALALPFLLVRAGQGELALILDVPENDIVIQLRSAYMSVADPALVPTIWSAQEF